MPEMKVVEKQPDGTEAAEDAVPAKPAKGKTLGIVAGAVVLGVVVGAFMLGPSLGGSSGAAEKKTASAGHAAGGGGHGEGSTLEIDNVVVNPAGAQGSHFLMATVALEVRDKDAEEYLRMNEHVVKDVIQSTLGRQTLKMLSQPGARDQIKLLLAQDIGQLVGDPGLLTVYLPEFVVQ